MEPVSLTAEVAEEMWALYHRDMPHFPDIQRSFEVFRACMFDPGTQIFHEGGTYIFLRDMYVPHTASMFVLTKRPIMLRRKQKLLLELMQAFSLSRVYVWARPKSPGARMCEIAGFVPEGVMRKQARFDGEMVDIQCFGFLPEDMNGKRKTEPNTAASLVARTFGA
jgi:hypothetical protein